MRPKPYTPIQTKCEYRPPADRFLKSSTGGVQIMNGVAKNFHPNKQMPYHEDGKWQWKDPVVQSDQYCIYLWKHTIGCKPMNVWCSIECRTWTSGPGGYSNYFLTACGVQGLKPLPIWIFCPQKWLSWLFFWNFRMGFLPKKWLICQFFRNFCEMGHSSKIFFGPKLDPYLRIFSEKVTHLGSTSLYALTCEYPPPLGFRQGHTGDVSCDVVKLYLIKHNIEL